MQESTDSNASTPCVIYVRLNSNYHSNKYVCIDSQKKLCEQYASKKKYDVKGFFQEENCSEKAKERESLWDAIESLPENGVLLVYSRESVSANDCLVELVNQLVVDRKSKIESVLNNMIEDGAELEEIRSFLSNINDYKGKFTAVKTRWAMLNKQHSGKRVGRYAPYGWKLDPDANGGMVVNPDEQIVIEAVHQMEIRNLTTAEIVRRLNAHFKDYARAKGGFQHKTVQKIIDRINYESGKNVRPIAERKGKRSRNKND